jgi:hypothetical protein
LKIRLGGYVSHHDRQKGGASNPTASGPSSASFGASFEERDQLSGERTIANRI